MMMSTPIIRVPTIKAHDFSGVFTLCSEFRATRGAVLIDFIRCEDLAYNGIAVLGGAIREATQRGVLVELNWRSASPALSEKLRQCGFTKAFGYRGGQGMDSIVPYREDAGKDLDLREIAEHLLLQWLRPEWVTMSDVLKRRIVSRVSELFGNASEHARSRAGIFSCGEYYEGKHNLGLCICDFGVGIPANVKGFLTNHGMADIDAIKWAFKRHNLTKPGSRGLGLDMVWEFLKVNKGELRTYSGGAAFMLDKKEVKFRPLPKPIQGTIIDIRVVCDERHYTLAPNQMPLRFG